MLTNKEFENLIQNNLPPYKKIEPKPAQHILHALPRWRKSQKDWLEWWKQESLGLRVDIQNFLFWLVRQDKFPIDVFGKIYDELTPIQSSLRTIPVSLVESDGTPKFEGGIVEQEWTLCNYSFKKTNEAGKWNVSFRERPDGNKPTTDLDLVLSALSFELRRKQNIAKIGFTPHHFQSLTHTQTEAIVIGTSPTLHKLPAIDPSKVDLLIEVSRIPCGKGLSVEELLRVRHRAITDSSNESKLITLWGTIEIEFGDEEKSERLLTEEEIDNIKFALKQILGNTAKWKQIISQISKLKRKTKNDIIKGEIKGLECSKGKNIDLEIQQVVKLRGKLAHGNAIDKSQRYELLKEVTFLFAVIDELIEKKIGEAINLKTE